MLLFKIIWNSLHLDDFQMARRKLGYGIGRARVGSKELEPKEWESECVESLEYDPESFQMTIHFNKRGTYVFYDVEPQVYAEFNNAGSRGTYFNLYIRNIGYQYERISL